MHVRKVPGTEVEFLVRPPEADADEVVDANQVPALQAHFRGRGRIRIKARVDDALSLMGSNQLFPRAQLPVNVGESRFEDITDRLPRAAVELN